MKNKFSDYDFEDLMEIIGVYDQEVKGVELEEIKSTLNHYRDIFVRQDTGFLVILKNINQILQQTMEKKENLYTELGWLLPVKFKDELLESKYSQLFEDIAEPLLGTNIIPAKTYNISFDDKVIERPVNLNMLRDFVCKKNFKYAVGFHSFYRDKIQISRDNNFSGIKLYMDNILLCDERN